MSKPCENCGCDLKVCKDCDLYTDKYCKTELQAELEKIKTRIDKDVSYVSKWQVKNDCIKIIDERISELNGE